MAPKTANLQHDLEHTELSEEDAKDFERRLAEFRDSLPEREKAALAGLVLTALGEPPSTKQGQGEEPAPTEEEIDAFAEKLNRFHDGLPGDQHLYVDDMLAKTWFKDEAEVQGYDWYPVNTWITITNKERFAYQAACDRAGGEWESWRIRHGGHRRFICWY